LTLGLNQVWSTLTTSFGTLPFMKILQIFCSLLISTWVLSAASKDIVIDVRTPAEFSAGHIRDAINIDYSVIARDITKLNLKADDRIILYCRSGRRSGIAQDVLRKKGFTNVENYGGLEQAQRRLSQKP